MLKKINGTLICCFIGANLIIAQNPMSNVNNDSEQGISVMDSLVVASDSVMVAPAIEPDSIYMKKSDADDLNTQIANLQSSVSENYRKIQRLNHSLSDKDDEIQRLNNQIIASDKALVTLASNFLYIPYEEYSIYQVAVPAFEKVHTRSIRQEYNNRYIILSNYKNHVVELRTFLQEINRQLAGSAMLRPASSDLSKAFESLKIYTDYIAYNDWKNTYLGKFLKRVHSIIVGMQNDSRPDVFKTLIEELDALGIK